MATYGDIKTRVAGNLVRTDLGTEIGQAINDAINEYASTRFWFNETRSVTFNTVPSALKLTSRWKACPVPLRHTSRTGLPGPFTSPSTCHTLSTPGTSSPLAAQPICTCSAWSPSRFSWV